MPIFTSVGVAVPAAVVAGVAAVVAAAAPVVAAPPAVVADELSESSPHAAATRIGRRLHHPPTSFAASKNSLGTRRRYCYQISTAQSHRRVRSRPHRCTARRTSPTSASVRVWSGDCKRSAYARLRARSPTDGPRYTSNRRRSASSGPAASRKVRSTSPAGITSGTTNARSMSDDGNRLTGRYRRSTRGRANSRSSSSCTHATR